MPAGPCPRPPRPPPPLRDTPARGRGGGPHCPPPGTRVHQLSDDSDSQARPAPGWCAALGCAGKPPRCRRGTTAQPSRRPESTYGRGHGPALALTPRAHVRAWPSRRCRAVRAGSGPQGQLTALREHIGAFLGRVGPPGPALTRAGLGRTAAQEPSHSESAADCAREPAGSESGSGAVRGGPHRLGPLRAGHARPRARDRPGRVTAPWCSG